MRFGNIPSVISHLFIFFILKSKAMPYAISLTCDMSSSYNTITKTVYMAKETIK